MTFVEQILAETQKIIAEEKSLDKRLDALEDTIASLGREQAPEVTSLTLIQSSLIRAELERSRRLWVRLSAILGVSLVGCLSLLLLTWGR